MTNNLLIVAQLVGVIAGLGVMRWFLGTSSALTLPADSVWFC